MAELQELYQQVIIDHSKRPRNFGEMESADRVAEGHNPLCGDRITLYLKVEGDVIRDIRFKSSGCAISTASASLLTESLKGKPLSEAERIFEEFHKLVTGAKPDTPMGKLAVFSGVCDYPTRVKCATLSWHTLRSAIRNLKSNTATE
jgi:nitrogen fixation protein NifU and related proteins